MTADRPSVGGGGVPQAGRLLVATPVLREPTFARTVILLLDHGDGGSLGLVLNRPMDVDVDAVLPAWQLHVTGPGRLFQGGPVGSDSALGLVAVPGDGAAPRGVRRIAGALGLVDLDADPSDVMGSLAGVRVFAGYAGWSPGQLVGEVQDGGWYVVDAEARDPFSDHPAGLWRQVLRRQSGSLAYVASFPDDPDLN
ncbi:MAG: YqgE/AlgH family protein [Angustibacter sp.]